MNYLSYESYACNRFFPFSVYNKLEKTNFTSINELPKIEYTNDIFQKLTTLNKDGFALKKIQPLYIKIGDNNYSRVLQFSSFYINRKKIYRIEKKRYYNCFR